MDSNGQRCWSMHAPHHWPLDPAARETQRVRFERGHGLRLRSRLADGTFVPVARSRAAVIAACDPFGAFWRWNGVGMVAVGAPSRDEHGAWVTPPPERVTLPAEITRVDAMALDADGMLFIAAGNTLWWLDRRERQVPLGLTTRDFAAGVLAARPQGGVWALDASRGELRASAGHPPWRQGVRVGDPEDALRFEPLEPSPDPARLVPHRARVSTGETAIDLACRADGLLTLLARRDSDGVHTLRFLVDDAWSPAFELGGGVAPYSIAWQRDGRLLALAHGELLAHDGTHSANAAQTVALAYTLDADTLDPVLAGIDESPPRLAPAGDHFPLHDHDGGAWLVPPPSSEQSERGEQPDPRIVRRRAFDALVLYTPVAVPLPSRARCAWRANMLPSWAGQFSDAHAAPSVIDSHDITTTWHRLFVEAEVPAGCAIVLWLATSEFAAPPLPASDAVLHESMPRPAIGARWWPHLIGDVRALEQALADWPELPRAAWRDAASEIAQGEARLACARERGRAGLFEVLVQRAGVAVRALRGRRLWVAAELFGNGRDTPTLAALRAWGSRFSYRDQYLPALYGETVEPGAADGAGRASASDFLERMLASYEGVLTGIEDGIAAAHRLTQPSSCPADALEWLGSWIGIAFEPGLPEPRRRAMLAAAPALWATHGTLEGIERALDLATWDAGTCEGAVSSGEVLVVENYRLRRTLATILGAELFDAEDPLIAGIVRSGNSVVGDSLVLGDAKTSPFLALFRRITDASGADIAGEREAAKHALYDGLAHRATVLVHEDLGALDHGLIRRVAAMATPAHVKVDVVSSPWPLLVAVASLVGVDTYLRAHDPGREVRLGASRAGWVDRLRNAGSLDARLNRAELIVIEPPRADPGPDRREPLDAPLRLSGARSRAARGRRITDYLWTLRGRP